MASQKVVVEGSNGVSASQLSDFFRQIGDGSIGKERLQAFLEHREPCRLLEAPRVRVKPLPGRFVPEDFFRTRGGLLVLDSFDQILENAEAVEIAAGYEARLRITQPTQSCRDSHIKAALLKDREVELWMIASLITNQYRGEEGLLRTDGISNTFFIQGLSVSLHRSLTSPHDWVIEAHDPAKVWRHNRPTVFSRP